MGSSVSSTVRTNADSEAGGGHSYSRISATGNARVLNGDIYNIRNFYGSWPDALPREWHKGASLNPVTALGKRRATSDLEDQPCRGGNPFLTMAISQLSEFSTSLRHQKEDEAARRIASWIRVILDAIETNHTTLEGAHTEKELAKMQDGLLLTNRVGVNSVVQRKVPEQVIKSRRKSSLIILGRWKIALDTTSWTALDQHAREMTGSFSALRLDPLDRASATPVAAFFGERTDYLHTTVIHPTIFAYRSVSDESEVFQAVECDDIASLMKLLAEQKATTRDLDEDGRSLLHFDSLNCCAFLIENGADVDGIAPTFDYESESAGTPLACVDWDHYTLRSGQCIALMLDAGADPSILARGTRCQDYRSPLANAMNDKISYLNDDAPWLLKRMVSGRLVDLTAPVSSLSGASIWLWAFLEGRKTFPEDLECLLDAGCDIHESAIHILDVPDGWNCLFLLVLKANGPEWPYEFETLRFILARGADIFAKDASGLTVFDYVNAPLTEKYSSYRRDLWYCALRREGLDTGQYTEMDSRANRYSQVYTPEHYRALCYLDKWHPFNFSQLAQETLEEHPWTEEEPLALSRIRLEKEKEKEETQPREMGRVFDEEDGVAQSWDDGNDGTTIPRLGDVNENQD